MSIKLLSRLFTVVVALAACGVFASAQTSAEIEAQNQKIQEINATVERTFRAGNAALIAKHFDEALAAYREGLAVSPEQVALLTNLSMALRARGVDTYNAAVMNRDADAKAKGNEAAAKDWLEAAEASQKALTSLSGVAPELQQQEPAYARNKYFALLARAQAMKLVATKVDKTQAQAAWDAYQQYIAVEADPAKKSKLKLEALQMLFDADAFDLAIAQSRITLAEDPANVGANRILGFALAGTEDKSKYAEAVKYLQIYFDKTPDTDPRRQDVQALFDFLKTQVQDTAEKTPQYEGDKPKPARRAGRRRH